MFRHLFFFLLTHFSVGLLFVVLFISLAEIGSLFFRLNTLIAFALMLFALLAQPFGSLGIMFQFSNLDLESATYLCFATSCLLIVLYNVLHPRLHKPLLATILLSGCAGIVGYALASNPGDLALSVKWLLAVNGFASALILGTVLGAMITGHWYLVQHNLSMKPLLDSARIFLGAVVLKLVVFLAGMLIIFGAERFLAYLVLLDFSSYLFIGRVAVGLVIPFVFGIMVWKSAKISSTQSATGILYATIILVLVGETFSKFLSF